MNAKRRGACAAAPVRDAATSVQREAEMQDESVSDSSPTDSMFNPRENHDLLEGAVISKARPVHVFFPNFCAREGKTLCPHGTGVIFQTLRKRVTTVVPPCYSVGISACRSLQKFFNVKITPMSSSSASALFLSCLLRGWCCRSRLTGRGDAARTSCCGGELISERESPSRVTSTSYTLRCARSHLKACLTTGSGKSAERQSFNRCKSYTDKTRTSVRVSLSAVELGMDWETLKLSQTILLLYECDACTENVFVREMC